MLSGNGRSDIREEVIERIHARQREAEETDAGVAAVPRTRLEEIDAAADTRLQTADAILAAAREISFESNPGLVNEDPTLKDRLREHANALYDGDPDRASELLAEVVASAKPDVRTVVAEVRREMQLQAELERFKERYPEIVADPHVARLADAYYDQFIRAGKTDADALEEAGKATRAYFRQAASEMGIRRLDPTTDSAGEGGVAGVIAEMSAERNRRLNHAQ